MMSKLPAGRTKPRTELELRALHGSDLAVMIDTHTDRTEYFEMQKGFDRRRRSVLESALRVVAVGGRRMKCFGEWNCLWKFSSGQRASQVRPLQRTVHVTKPRDPPSS